MNKVLESSSGGVSVVSPLAAARANEVFKETKDLTAAFNAAKEYYDNETGAASEEIDEDVETEALRREYYIAICNAVRGVSDLDGESARKAAAVLKIPCVSFAEWRARTGE